MTKEELIEIIQSRLSETGLTAAEASQRAVGNRSLIANIKRPRYGMPSVDNLAKLGEVLGYELSFGPPRGAASTKQTFAVAQTLPHMGFAKCSLRGWGEKQPEMAPLPKPEFINDPDAFYVSAAGQSMIPEGIKPNDYCLISPAQDIKEGDRIWIETGDGRFTIKRLEKMTGRSLVLRGWLPIQDSKQQSFDDEVVSRFVKKAHPVVAVFRGKPGDPQSTFVPDPKGDEPQVISGPIGEDFAAIRLHDVQLAAGDGAKNWPNSATSALAFPKPWLHQNGISPAAASLVWISGDSMLPTLKSGAMAIINHNRRDPRKRRVYALRQGDELRVKRLERLGPDQLLITSDNPDYPAELLSGADLDDVEIIGEVVWSGAALG